jgi:hypothetical protein
VSGKMRTFREVLGAQRKTILVAIVLAVLGLFVGQYGDWVLAGCISPPNTGVSAPSTRVVRSHALR